MDDYDYPALDAGEMLWAAAMFGPKKPQDWEVRVYLADSDVDPFAKWIIEGRTEQEASREAAADVQNEFPNAGDWTLTPVVVES